VHDGKYSVPKKWFVKQACYEGKRPLGRHRSGWEDNTALKWIIERYDGVVWTELISLRIEIMNL
jgi:hypothetical protein